MHFEGQFRVPGRPEEVIHRFADVRRMASCLPGAMLETEEEDGSWNGTLLVTFGPKKIRFKGKVKVETDIAGLSGRVSGRGAADMRAARVGVTLTYRLLADEAAAEPTTICALVSDAELTGVLADFARTGGQAFATALMEEFSKRAQAEFSRPDEPELAEAPARAEQEPVPAAPRAAERAPPPPVAEPAALSAHGLLWAMIKATVLRWLGKLGLRRAG
jgi:hypothetical protein